MASPISVVPAAQRLMESLRDIGYTLPAAVADLVDNSVDAGARRIDIALHFAGDASWIRVSDDGSGMTGSQLDEAMRYGSRRDYERRELGKFGLGLKTASLSQCRTLTVASRRGEQRRRIEIRRWSLDHIAKSHQWHLLRPEPAECPPELIEPLDSGPGTVILWEQLDRLLRYRNPRGGAAENGFAALSIAISEHLGMVFHRFLGGQVRKRPRMTIFVNDDPVRPWDPFARDQEATRILPSQAVEVATRTGTRYVRIAPHILPREDRFSDRAAHARAAGPRRWNRQQGLYIYRSHRLIQSGGWNRLRAEDEHTKLARIAVDIPLGCDELFQINVSKMSVALPADLRASLKAIVTGVAADAQAAYRRPATALSGLDDVVPVRRIPSAPDEESNGARSCDLPPRIFEGRLGVHWDAIERVLVEELGGAGDPHLLSRILRRLREEAAVDGASDQPVVSGIAASG